MNRQAKSVAQWTIGTALGLVASWCAFQGGNPPPLPSARGEGPLKHLWHPVEVPPKPCGEASQAEQEYLAKLAEVKTSKGRFKFILDGPEDLGDSAGCKVVHEYLRLALKARQLGLYRQGKDLYLHHILPLAQGLGRTDNVASALGRMAVLDGFAGNLPEAQAAQEASLYLLTLLGDHRRLAQQTLSFAHVQYRFGLHKEAVESLDKIHSRFEHVGSHQHLASALTLMARSEVSLFVRGQSQFGLSRARKNLDKAWLLRWQEPDADKRDKGLLSTLDALGRVLIESNKRAEAESVLLEALEIVERRWVRAKESQRQEAQEKIRRDRQAVMVNLAEVKLLNGDATGALELTDRASRDLPSGDSRGLPEVSERINLLSVQALAHSALNQQDEALHSVRRMVAGSEAARFGKEIVLAPFFDSRRKYFEIAVDLLASSGVRDEAFNLVELLRARGLLDGLMTQAQPWQLPRQVQAENAALIARTQWLRTELAELSADSGRDRQEITSRLFDLLDAEQQIREASGVESAAPLRRSQIDELLEPGTLGMVFWLGHQRSWLWLLEAGREDRLIRLPKYCESFNGDATKLRQKLGSGIPHEVPDLIERLADCFVPDETAKEAVGRAQRLLVVGDGALTSTPLAVLPHPIYQHKRLIEELPITFVPSLSILAALHQRSAWAAREPDPRRELILIAAPAYNDTEWSTLPGAQQEARGIRQHLTPSFELLGTAASLPRIRREGLADARIIHFATHAQLHESHPESSALILSEVNDVGESVESKLTLTDLVALRMNADLVVLSACKTGLGEPATGAGPMAFPAAFLHAGASGVIASLWDVHDGPTAELMTEVYAGLANGLDPAEALRGGQRAMIDGGYGPENWAGWVFLGDRNSGN